MKRFVRDCPYSYLETYRGKAFNGEWPTLPQLFRITVERFGGRPCWTDFRPQKTTLNYREALSQVEALANYLASRGVGKGDRIALSGKNCSEWTTVFLAVVFCGATIVPLDYALHDDEMLNLLATAAPKMFFIDDEKFAHFSNIFSESGGIAGERIELFSLGQSVPDRYVLALKCKKSFELSEADEDDVAAILFTSGTTGVPKGVMLTHKNFVSDAYIAQWSLVILPTDVFYALLPIHHAYTMQAVFIEALAVGGSVVFGRSMAVTRILREMKEGGVTIFLGVPLLFNKLLAGIMKGIRQKGLLPHLAMRFLMKVSHLIYKLTGRNPGKKMFRNVLAKANLDSIRVMISGGGPLAPSVFREYNELGVEFIQGYGLTETSPIIALNPKEAFRIESVGCFHPADMQIKTLRPNSRGTGELIVKGPMVMKGYYKMPEETAAAFTPDGWFKTGDLGFVDKDNYVYLRGRAKNMIVTEGGKNVYPEEIENHFQTFFNEIEQITVVAYSEKGTKGEKVEAKVYPTDALFKLLKIDRNKNFAPQAIRDKIQDLINFVNAKLQPYARISKLTILKKPLEMTSTRKVKRGKIDEAEGDDGGRLAPTETEKK